MIAVDLYKGQRVALLGLAGSGLVTARALQAGGADVVAQDDDQDRVTAAEEAGITRGDLRTEDWSKIAALVLAPGVPLTHPKPHWSVDLAKANDIEVIGDVELFYRVRRRLAPTAPVVAITGTNGKSTTTALAAHLLASAGFDVQTGGNIGRPVLDLDPPDPAHPKRVHVLEMSSYQIDLSPTCDPTVGVLLNLSPDHLDRHGTMEHYASVKERLVAGATQAAIVGIDDHHCRDIARRLGDSGKAGRGLEFITVSGTAGATWSSSGSVLSGPSKPSFADLSASTALRGGHNAQNALAAAAAAHQLGIGTAEIAAGLETFPGLDHRMQPIGRRGNVLFVNDSKATNADSAARALATFDTIYWIAGGVPKAGGIKSLTEYFPKIRHSYLIGEAAEAFERTLRDAGCTEVRRCASLAEAVAEAAVDAGRDEAGDVAVLLSPACASFDQFANFEQRGQAFRDAVQALKDIGKP